MRHHDWRTETNAPPRDGLPHCYACEIQVLPGVAIPAACPGEPTPEIQGSSRIDVFIDPLSKKTMICVNGEDVTVFVREFHIGAQLDGDGFTRVVLYCYDVNENGVFYAEDGPDGKDVARRNVVLERATVQLSGASGIEFLKTAAARLRGNQDEADS